MANKSEQIIIRVSESEKGAIQREAEAHGQSVTAYLLGLHKDFGGARGDVSPFEEHVCSAVATEDVATFRLGPQTPKGFVSPREILEFYSRNLAEAKRMIEASQICPHCGQDIFP